MLHIFIYIFFYIIFLSAIRTIILSHNIYMKYDGNLYKYLKEYLKLDETNIDYQKPPREVTYEMLKSSMGNSRDFKLKIKEIEKDKRNMVAEALWSPYAKIMFPPNNFGLYVEENGVKHMNFAIKITPHKEKKTTSLLRETLFSKPISPLQIKSKGNTRFSKPKTKRTQRTRLAGGKNKKSKKKYSRKQKGGVKFEGRTPLMRINYPNDDRSEALKLYNYPGTALYSMQIPDNNDRLALLQQFAYMMYHLEIDSIIDLHSCGTGLHPSGRYTGFEGCYELIDEDEKEKKELYINSERETWEFVKKLDRENINNDNIQFWDDREGVGIEDFTAGTLNGWFKLSEYPEINDPENNKLAIHCQSGFGRSGIVSLFYLLRDVFHQEYDIEKKYMGFGSSREMFDFLEEKLEEEYQKSEVFGQCSQLFSQRLFISRINYILLAIYTYTYNEITEPSFYLYLLPEEQLPIIHAMPDKELDFEESETLLHEQIFVPVLVNYEKIRSENGDRAIEALMRRNKFLLGQHERKDDE
jgi:hypothetical protein